MAERSRASEKPRRATAVDPFAWRFQQRRAEGLGVDFEALVKELSSRSTEWRVAKGGATPQLLKKVEARLAEIEQERGTASRSALLKEWNEVGADLLELDDKSDHFRQALMGAREVLEAGRKLRDALNVFRKK